jgi:hypothetical protein
MDLHKALGQPQNKALVNKIVRYIGEDADRFEELVNLYLKGPYRITQHAAWPLGYCVEHHPKLIIPHLKKILDYLKTPGIHDAVKRNTLRLLQFIDIPGKYQGKISAICFDYLQDPKEAIAIRVFSMAVLARIAQHHPDMKQELRLIIEDHLPYASAAYRSRAQKVLKEWR